MEDIIEKKDFALCNPKDNNEIIKDEYRAAFYRSVMKPDSTGKVFPKKVSIKIEDIKDLNSMIVEKLTYQYENAGSYFSAVINHTSRQTYEITQWEKFYTQQWMDSTAINSIILTWTFNAILPEQNIPQKHTLVVKLSNGLTSQEMLNLIFTGNIENLSEFDSEFFPIVARVDFINKMIGDELLNIVGKWVEGLEKPDNFRSKFILFLKKHSLGICFLLDNISFIVLTLLGLSIITYIINSLKINLFSDISIEKLISIIRYTVIIFVITSIVRTGIKLVSKKIMIALDSYGVSHIFEITKGDHKQLEIIEKLEKGKGYYVFFRLGLMIILNVICGIFANYICKLGGI